MVAFMAERSDAAGCGAHLVDSRGRPDLGCADRPGLGREIMAAAGLDKIFKKNRFLNPYFRNYLSLKTPQEVPVISGADLMVRKDLFKKLGGFDEKFFFYYEDTDLCLRLNAAGLKLFYLPEVTMVHVRGGTIGDFSRQKFLEWRKSRLYFYKKNFRSRQFLMVKYLILFTLALRFILFPVFWLGQLVGLKKKLEKYSLYFAAWKMIINYE